MKNILILATIVLLFVTSAWAAAPVFNSPHHGVTAIDDAVMGGPVVDVRHPDYGAVGDGVTDDSAAIQAAIDAIPSTGGVVVFPAGNYHVDTGLTTGLQKSLKLI